MAERGERMFKLAATLETVEKGQNLSEIPHTTILRWLHEGMPMGEFESRLEVLFGAPNPFMHPDSPGGVRVARKYEGSAADTTELTGMSRWPYLGVGTLVRSLEGRLVNEEFMPTISGIDPATLGEGSRVKFASVAVAEYGQDESAQEIVIVKPVINAPKARG